MDFSTLYKKIVSSYKKSPSLYRESLFWKHYNKLNQAQLEERGYENFKQTANWNYYQFEISSIRNIYLLFLFSVTPKLESLKILLRSKIKNCSLPWFRRLIYKYFIGTLYEFVAKIDSQKILDGIAEPLEGNPVLVSYKNKLLSQDVLSSTLEFYTLEEAAQISQKKFLKIAELGAGYGRLAYLITSLLKNKDVKYCIFDIPPALCVAEYYLTRVFPDIKILKFREFKNFKEIKKEFEKSQICLFLPYQLELLPPKIFDIFISISNLPEMRFKQIANYFKQINRLCRGYYYNKQFWDHFNAQDNLRMRFIDYPALPNWRPLLLRPALAQKDFF